MWDQILTTVLAAFLMLFGHLQVANVMYIGKGMTARNWYTKVFEIQSVADA